MQLLRRFLQSAMQIQSLAFTRKVWRSSRHSLRTDLVYELQVFDLEFLKRTEQNSKNPLDIARAVNSRRIIAEDLAKLK